MKKSIVLLTIMLLNMVAFSQANNFGNKSIIEVKQPYELNSNTIEGNNCDYYFKVNNMLYVLAYRVKDEKNWYDKTTIDVNNLRTKRDLLLYRLDSAEWIESSTVVQTDYELLGVEQDYGTHKSYGVVEYSKLLKKGLGSGQVRLLSNGCIVMVLMNEYITPESKDVNFDYNAIVILVPNVNGTYLATRFEPKDKTVNDLCANDTLKINESSNTIKLEIWNRYNCKENENPDGYSIYDSDTNGKKFKNYYKKKYFTTLNFELSGKKVIYSGSYGLIQAR